VEIAQIGELIGSPIYENIDTELANGSEAALSNLNRV